MVFETIIRTTGLALNDTDERRLQHQLDSLERRLVHHPEPTAVLALTGHKNQRQVEVDLRVQLGPLGAHLISRQRAETADRALRLAIEDIERQLERHHASQSGEATYGVPSRRLPAALRPSSFTPGAAPGSPREETEEEATGEQ